MQFPMFEGLRSRIHEHRERKGLNSGSLLETGTVTAVSAGTAGSIAAVITTPIDVVKTRIMLSAAGDGHEERERAAKEIERQGGDAKAEAERLKKVNGGRVGGLTVAKEVLKAEGVRGLFRGGALRGLWTAVGAGLYLGVYESGRKYLEGRRSGTDEGREAT